MYPKFEVPGVQPEDVWQLFNVGNYKYYKEKIEVLRKKDPKERCSFCTIDPTVNHVLFENNSWRLWMNEIAPRPGQKCQLVMPSKRHVERFSELTRQEKIDFWEVHEWAVENLGVGDEGVLFGRSGPHVKNAKSMPHFHFNFHEPTGESRVEVTIAKSPEDLLRKLPTLKAFEKYRVAEEMGHPQPWRVLTGDEWSLINNKMEPPKTER